MRLVGAEALGTVSVAEGWRWLIGRDQSDRPRELGTFGPIGSAGSSALMTLEVRSMTEEQEMIGAERATVVAGVDGSEGSIHAALVGAWEATVRKAKLELVSVARIPMTADGFGVAEAYSAAEVEARDALGKAAEAVRKAFPDLEVETSVRSSSAIAGELLDAAKGAELLVVGSRGHGGFVGLLLGSVSSQVVHHPPCPVLVVPPEPTTGAPGEAAAGKAAAR